MGYDGLRMGCYCFLVCFWGLAIGFVNGNSVVDTVFVNGKGSIGKIDNDFVCATVDWWPSQKCDYGSCSWGNASLLNVVSLGSQEQDLFQCSKRASVIFGLNALTGRSIRSDGTAVGNWDNKNAEAFMRYTVKKKYKIHGWELGNELCGVNAIGTRVAADQYAFDTISLQKLANNVYGGIEPKPLIIAPGGFLDANWFTEYISKTNNLLDIATQHIYNLYGGSDEDLIKKILDPTVLDGGVWTFRSLQNIVKKSGKPVNAWVGEAGGVNNSGRKLVTNSFVFSFWYLDQMGMSSLYGTQTYCRQSLIGGNYGLLNTTTYVPNPDYYSALLWHRLMGRNVLSTKFNRTKNIRAYAHCAKQSKGITVLLINLDRSTTIEAKVSYNGTLIRENKSYPNHKSNPTRLPQESKKKQHYNGELSRIEYHLTPKSGNLHSQVMLLNGKVLSVDKNGQIPPLKGILINSSKPITVAPFSIVFVQIPNVDLPACR